MRRAINIVSHLSNGYREGNNEGDEIDSKIKADTFLFSQRRDLFRFTAEQKAIHGEREREREMKYFLIVGVNKYSSYE